MGQIWVFCKETTIGQCRLYLLLQKSENQPLSPFDLPLERADCQNSPPGHICMCVVNYSHPTVANFLDIFSDFSDIKKTLLLSKIRVKVRLPISTTGEHGALVVEMITIRREAAARDRTDFYNLYIGEHKPHIWMDQNAEEQSHWIKNQQVIYTSRTRNTRLKTARCPIWTGRADCLREEWKKSSTTNVKRQQ